jgi:hypothetical protein
VGPVHKILTNTVYVGRWRFNQVFSKTGRRKAEDEIVEIPVPAIVDPDIFEQVQRQLHARSPKVQAPRMTTGPILLTGLAVCATCRAGMMLRTGTLSDADDKLKRLYQLIEEGVTDLDDVLKDRLNTLKAERDRAREALARAQEHQSPPIEIDPATIDRFARALRESFSTCSVPFRKAYLRALIDVIEVDDHQVRIKGSKSVLERALVASQNTTSGCSQMSTRWRARRDSNS